MHLPRSEYVAEVLAFVADNPLGVCSLVGTFAVNPVRLKDEGQESPRIGILTRQASVRGFVQGSEYDWV